mmetsp:Transcript_15313/g.45106  ORF Transcript_15313/g.45106 Transcript_15313/m.45106 type:complete len:251 (+) Transcript_15313:187-939(+)
MHVKTGVFSESPQPKSPKEHGSTVRAQAQGLAASLRSCSTIPGLHALRAHAGACLHDSLRPPRGLHNRCLSTTFPIVAFPLRFQQRPFLYVYTVLRLTAGDSRRRVDRATSGRPRRRLRRQASPRRSGCCPCLQMRRCVTSCTHLPRTASTVSTSWSHQLKAVPSKPKPAPKAALPPLRRRRRPASSSEWSRRQTCYACWLACRRRRARVPRCRPLAAAGCRQRRRRRRYRTRHRRRRRGPTREAARCLT